ncbi:MAG: ThiF family adenylyltransferase [Planctomycetota bacterium]|nr:ThiF family adenylyltransferase [Planctomycetota bacterium]
MQRPDFARRHHPPVEGHVLVVGTGGLGCPAAWALRAAGVTRLTLVDPDRVELSNLPRQILFADADLDHPKAEVAASLLGGVEAGVHGVHARLDDSNAEAILDGVDVIVDATDGARTKDWLNQLAVRRGLPLIHAAGLRSEGRLLPVPPGGAPCLACLFGRLVEETGACADLGVWNGVVGTVGFLAAQAALRCLAGDAPEPAYTVFDFEAGSGFALGVRAAASCPVCAGGDDTVEAYPDAVACETAPGDASTDENAPAPDAELDLRTERCPMNLLRARKALQDAAPGHVFDIALGEEGAATVPDGVRALGHEVLRETPEGEGVRLLVRRGGGDAAAAAFDDDALRRYARQLVLPDVGEAGQRRLLEARVTVVAPPGVARDVAVTYLRAAGVPAEGASEGEGEGEGAHALPTEDAPIAVAMARAAAWADALQRSIVHARALRPAVAIDADGVVGQSPSLP